VKPNVVALPHDNKPYMEPREIVTRTAITRLEADGVVLVITLPAAVQTLADARENMRAFGHLAGGQRRPMLLDMRQIKLFAHTQ
jgi:hypothetical protein